MIPNQTQDVSIESTAQGEDVRMTLDEESLVHLMSVLTNLYSDPEMAVLREYSTNARDSHIEAGVSLPVEIKLPDSWAQFLTIKDYGVGLSADDIRAIYSKYGASTKRDTNDQTGVLGLGCKSALTYTPQFTLVGIKHGVKTTVQVSLDEDGAGMMRILDESETDESSGVEVIIPTRQGNSFRYKAERLFRFWDAGSVLIDGNEPERVEGLEVGPNLIVTTEIDRDTIVMGGVPYPFESGLPLKEGYNVVAYAPMGSVSFTPSREDLSYTSTTKRYIEQVKSEYAEYIDSAVQESIDRCEDAQEAFRAAITWRRGLGNLKLTYKGKEIPDKYEPGQKMIAAEYDAYKLSAHQRAMYVATGYINKALIVTNFGTTKSFTAGVKKKLKKYVADINMPNYWTCNFLLLEGDLDKEMAYWVDPEYVVDYSVIAALKIYRKGAVTGSRGRISGSYDMYVDGDFKPEEMAENIDTSNPLFYMDMNSMARRNGLVARVLTELYPNGYTLVIMTANRVTKFARDFPEAQHPKEALKAAYETLAQGANEREILKNALKNNWRAKELVHLDPAKVDDPDLRDAIEMMTEPIDMVSLEPLEDYKPLLPFLGLDDKLTGWDWDCPLDKYPLADGYELRGGHDHIYIYINAVYAAEQGKEQP